MTVASCTQTNKNSNVHTESSNIDNTYLLKRAQQDIDKTQNSSFDLFSDFLPKNKYVVDTTHSSVQFRVRHWGIYDVVGRLESYEIVVYYDKEDFSDMVIEARMGPASINMPNKEMASHLKTEGFGFFDVNKYPEVIFKSTRMEMVSDSTFKLIGSMTIKETTKEVVFDVELNGYAYPPNKSMPGFTINGRINRLDFNLGGTELLPGNGLPMIGNDVYITSNIRLIKNYDQKK